MSCAPNRAAALILARRRDGLATGPLASGMAPNTEADGVAAQLALARLMRADPPAGFKIGATAMRMQRYLGLAGPVAGFMPRTGILDSGASLPWSAFCGPGVECEIGVKLSCDLPPGQYESEQAARAVHSVFAAIEVVDNRYGPPPAGDLEALGTPTLIADQIYHAAAIVGSPVAYSNLPDLAAVVGRLTVDGRVRGEGRGADLLGHPMVALAWLAGSDVVRAFGGLRAGQIVMLGSVTPPIWLDVPGTAQVEFVGLGQKVAVTIS